MPKPNRVTFKIAKPCVVVSEYLRYAGACGVTSESHTGYVPHNIQEQLGRLSRHDADALVTMYAPHGVLRDVWARQQVERLASFGVKAVAWAT